MKKKESKQLMCGVGIGMVVGGCAAIAGSMMQACKCKKSKKIINGCEKIFSEIGSAIKG